MSKSPSAVLELCLFSLTGKWLHELQLHRKITYKVCFSRLLEDSRWISLPMKAVPYFTGHTHGATFWLAALFTCMPENLNWKEKLWQGICSFRFQFSFSIPVEKCSLSATTPNVCFFYFARCSCSTYKLLKCSYLVWFTFFFFFKSEELTAEFLPYLHGYPVGYHSGECCCPGACCLRALWGC